MSLFQESIIRKHLGYLNQEVVEQAYFRFKEVYSANKITNIKVAKEEQYQEGFIKDIFGAVLGYSVFPEQPFNIQTEKKNEANSKKADGAIMQGENVVGVIELKDNKTKNLDAVKDQAFGYKNNHKDCSYVISSNFHKLRFYLDDATDYEEFDLYNLDKETFKRFYLYLRKEGLLDKNIPKLLRQETKFHEENITKSLYKDYSSFKNSFFQNVVENNPQYDKLLLFKKSQKFLDKVLFVLFAEDKGLVSTNSIVQIVEKWNDLKNDAFDTPKPLYQLVALFFNNLFIGKKDQKGEMLIPEFGGEIFAPDEVLDTLIVDDEVLKNDLLKLSKYDFNTDVDVNILGHIFEHSLSEIEEVEASLKGEVADKTKGKRKKDGVFYTPKYITKYIVENTVGKLCSEKKAELELDQDIAIFELQKADGKLNAKGIELYTKLNQYKDWLLTLKILDPACGSGAFLNQAVNFLVQEHKFFDDIIAELTNSPLRLFDTDIAILENNIYGVDINEESIEIAKLSLWLRTAKQGRKLSILSNNIKCGNSLIDDQEVAGDKAFNWQNEFHEVFASGGFDVVIGNPPYVVYIKSIFGDKTVNFINKNFKYAEYNPNTYALFTELAIERILKSGGRLGFIMPNSWLTGQYFSRMRKGVYNKKIEEIDYLKNEVFAEVVETAVLILQNLNGAPDIIKLSSDVREIPRIEAFDKTKYLEGYNPFISEEDPLVSKIENTSLRLNEVAIVYRGLETKDNKIWLSESKESELHVPIYLGRDINRYHQIHSGTYVKYIKKEMKSNANEKMFQQPKVLMRRTGSTIIASLDLSNEFALKNLYVIVPIKDASVYSIVAQLNSKLFAHIHKMKTSAENKAFAQFQGIYVGNFPYRNCLDNIKDLVDKIMLDRNNYVQSEHGLIDLIQSKFDIPNPSKKLQDWSSIDFKGFLGELEKAKVKLTLPEEAEWMKYFNAEKQKLNELKRQITQIDKEIDQMVYTLYELSDEEIRIVEESSK